MASPTPGILLKLLQSMNADSITSAGDERRRPAVLQVIGIVPAVSASSGDVLSSASPPHSFLLQLSDSLHSTYVALSAADADAVLSSRFQLGQLVLVDRLLFDRPFPRALGLRPLPCSRPPPFSGTPEPLVARSSPNNSGFVIQPASPSDVAQPLMPSDPTAPPPLGNDSGGQTATSSGNAPPAAKRRFSSPSNGKMPAGRRISSEPRDASPSLRPSLPTVKSASRPASPSVRAAGALRSASPSVRSATPRASSPAPSKCVVPSLVMAKEENRRVPREPIIVPSRYRQPSPSSKRSSLSPARRASAGMRVSPAAAAGEASTKRKGGIVVAGITKIMEGSAGPLKPGRKSWDESMADSSGSVLTTSETKANTKNYRSKVDRSSILRTQEEMSKRLSDASTEHSTNEDPPSVEKKARHHKGGKKDCSRMVEKPAEVASMKITFHDSKWTDGTVPLDNVSDNLAKLGKEFLARKEAVSTMVVDALQEAVLMESITRNLSMFCDLCALSKACDPLPTVDQFLVIYNSLISSKKIAEHVTDIHGIEESEVLSPLEKSASMWVTAALASDLEVVKLLNISESTSFAKRKKGGDIEKPATPSISFPRSASISKRHSFSAKTQSKVMAPPNPAIATSWNKVSGANTVIELAIAMQQEMQGWFLRFVDEALDVGFMLSANNGGGGGKDEGCSAAVLSQFKRINDWLDSVGKAAIEEVETKEKIEGLKRKIYGFVISRMELTFEKTLAV